MENIKVYIIRYQYLAAKEMKEIFFLGLLILVIPQSQAALVTTSKTEVCSILSEIGLKTKGWKKFYGDEYGCLSPYKDIGSGVLPNNIAFYVEGNKSSAREVKLVININNNSDANLAHRELLKASKLLSRKAIGRELPKEVVKAILSGASFTKKVADSIVKVQRVNWPSGNGYEVKVIME
ncbi:MAG: hypothetical protein OQK04_11530 [Kangiellaceae bacterium]|nr:hypothetical protein [Kangiellaceae bacterium]MCW8999334.1 hypothetical protein [Kangiellaceae bacterium]